jgi:hypothetical protein
MSSGADPGLATSDAKARAVVRQKAAAPTPTPTAAYSGSTQTYSDQTQTYPDPYTGSSGAATDANPPTTHSS